MSGIINQVGARSGNVTSGFHKIEVHKSSHDGIGGTSSASYVSADLTFTPSFTCKAIAMVTLGFRGTGTTTHNYFQPHLCLAADDSVLVTYIQVAARDHSPTNQHFISFAGSDDYSLTGGTAYKLRLKATDLGASLSTNNDAGQNLHYTALCFV